MASRAQPDHPTPWETAVQLINTTKHHAMATLATLATVSAIGSIGLGLTLNHQPDTTEQMEAQREAARDEALKGLRKRTPLIAAEIKALDLDPIGDHWADEWAGNYYVGDGLGMNVSFSIAPDAGVAFTWNGCTGLYAFNHGDIVEVFDDGLRVRWAVPPSNDFMDWSDERLYFVHWGKRRYLIPEKLINEVVKDYNNGGFDRRMMGSAAVMHGDTKRFSDPPNVPLELPSPWREQLITEVFHPTITEINRIESDKHWHTLDLKLDVGSEAGISVGMNADWRSAYSSWLEVTEVWEGGCRLRGRLLLGQDSDGIPPKVGDTVELPSSR